MPYAQLGYRTRYLEYEDKESAMRLCNQAPLLGFVVNRTLYASSEAYRQRIDYICKLMRLAGADRRQSDRGQAEKGRTRRERQACLIKR